MKKYINSRGEVEKLSAIREASAGAEETGGDENNNANEEEYDLGNEGFEEVMASFKTQRTSEVRAKENRSAESNVYQRRQTIGAINKPGEDEWPLEEQKVPVVRGLRACRAVAKKVGMHWPAPGVV